ncbi:MAG: HEAT repeat domain-containing protein, partial [Planctomycetes bacterium]|nr:HEAT repeat domain-containing protein [Planctomycetota bacterium]
FGGEVLANSDVIGLSRANMTPEVIIAKIHSTPNIFDISTRSLIALKENGVSDDVIRAMMVAAERSSPHSVMDEGRFRTELENIAGGTPEAKNSGLAWMVANREQSRHALRRSLADSRPEIRAAAAQSLGRTGDRESLPAMRNLLTDPSHLVRAATAQALSDLNDVSAISAAEQAVARQLAPLDGYARLIGHARLTQSAGALGRALESNPDPLSRIAAAWALGEIGRAGIAGRPSLERALQSDPDPWVRREAVLAVAKLHDSQSAALLKDACRRDPEVRKTTLAAMFEYPETAEFLVWVLNLDPDQIAADELETARNSLARLTGQDFGLDGIRWSEWFAANRSRFGDIPPPISPPPVRPVTPQVDVETWGIVTDSAVIPMAPQVADLGPPPGRASPFDSVGGFSSSMMPAAPSPMDFAGSSAGLTPSGTGFGPETPAGIPGLDFGVDGTGGFSSDSVNLRTWTSDPSRLPPPAGGREAVPMPPDAPARTSSAAPPMPADSDFGLFGPLRPPDGDDDIFSGIPSFEVADSQFLITPPSQSPSVVSPMPAAGVEEDTAELMRGISLPMPPMDSGAQTLSSLGDGSAYPPADYAAPHDVTDHSFVEGAAPVPTAVPGMSEGVVFSTSPEYLEYLPDEAGSGQGIAASPFFMEPDSEVLWPTLDSGPMFVEPDPGQFVIDGTMPDPERPDEFIPGYTDANQSQPIFVPLTPESFDPSASAAAAPVFTESFSPPPGIPALPAGETDSFRDPSTPLPPVTPEGMIQTPKGRDQPPLLGEGMFGR